MAKRTWTHIFTRHTDAAGSNNEAGMEGIRCRVLHEIKSAKSYGNRMVELNPEDVARINPILADFYSLTGGQWDFDYAYCLRHHLVPKSILIEANERTNNTEIQLINS